MTEKTLKEYLDAKVTVDILAAELKYSKERTGCDSITVRVDPIQESGKYQITRQHLLKLCCDCLDRYLTPEELNIISFALICSEYFTWDENTKDGEVITTTIYDWDNSEIGFSLTKENLSLWREYLESGDYKLDKTTCKNHSNTMKAVEPLTSQQLINLQ